MGSPLPSCLDFFYRFSQINGVAAKTIETFQVVISLGVLPQDSVGYRPGIMSASELRINLEGLVEVRVKPQGLVVFGQGIIKAAAHLEINSRRQGTEEKTYVGYVGGTPCGPRDFGSRP